MEQLVATIIGLSSSDAELRQLQDQLSFREDELQFVLGSGSTVLPSTGFEALDSLVAQLDMERHCLGCAHIFQAQARLLLNWRVTNRWSLQLRQSVQRAQFNSACKDFLHTLLMFLRRLQHCISFWKTRQLRLGPKVLTQLCKTVSELACDKVVLAGSLAPAALSAEVLAMVVKHIEPDAGVLTPMHADVLRCFLIGKRYSAAIAFAQDKQRARVSWMDPSGVLPHMRRAQCSEADRLSRQTGAAVSFDALTVLSKAEAYSCEFKRVMPPNVAKLGHPKLVLPLRTLNQTSSSLAAAHKTLFREQQSYIIESGLEPTHVLLTLYYAGVAHIANSCWTEAVATFKACIHTPAFATSAITVAAAKKMVLCAILSDDEVSALDLPKHCPVVVSRFLRSSGSFQRYRELAKDVLSATVTDGVQLGVITTDVKAFSDSKECGAADLLLSGHSVFNRDGNCALAKRARNHICERKTVELRRVYSTLALSDVSSRLGLYDISRTRTFLERLAPKHACDLDVIYTIDASSMALRVIEPHPEPKYHNLDVSIVPCECLCTHDLKDQVASVYALARTLGFISDHLQAHPNFLIGTPQTPGHHDTSTLDTGNGVHRMRDTGRPCFRKEHADVDFV